MSGADTGVKAGRGGKTERTIVTLKVFPAPEVVSLFSGFMWPGRDSQTGSPVLRLKEQWMYYYSLLLLYLRNVLVTEGHSHRLLKTHL